MLAYGADVDAICVHVSLDLRSLPAKPQPANRCPLPLNLRWDQFGLTSRYWSERQRRIWPAASQPASQPAGEPARQPACQPEDFPGAAQRLPRSCLGGEGGRNLKTIVCQTCLHSDTKTYPFGQLPSQSYRGVQSGWEMATVAQKMLLEKGGGTQNTNRPSEMRPKMHTVQQKCKRQYVLGRRWRGRKC